MSYYAVFMLFISENVAFPKYLGLRDTMDLGLAGKNVLIVGASKGIGRGIAVGFASEKA